MRCEQCGFEGTEPTRYCGGCGTLLTSACPACGTPNPLDFRFCGGCGAALPIHLPEGPVAAAAAAAAAPARAARPAERRQLTVMFCDLVGSTSLSTLLDPEELRELVHAYQDAASAVIERYEGHVAQYLGDGILAYFGYPTALENEAGRAVRAGREVVTAIGRLNRRPDHPPEITLSARVGIHTGVVVVGESGGARHREQLALGETPNVAARIQAAAGPDEVVLSADTYRLVRHEIECTPLGPRAIRGLAAPLELYRPGADVSPDLPVLPASAEPTELVGRQAETELLEQLWESATAGEGAVVRVTGEPGLGKSALVRALAGTVSGSGALVIISRCLPYFRSSPLHPIAEAVRRWLLVEASEPGTGARERLRLLLERHALAEALPYLASLLGLRSAARESATPPPPPRWRERTAEAVVELLLRASSERPLLFCLEDLHWADPSTLELVGTLADRSRGHPLLALLTHRPDLQPQWPRAAGQHELVLGRLSAEEAAALVTRVAAPRTLAPAAIEGIVQRTDGVPFFVEELTRMVLDGQETSGRPRGPEARSAALLTGSIPLTLHDSLEARLDRLGSARELAQLGAVLGRDFSHELIARVARLDEDELERSLEQLVDEGLLTRSGSERSAVYSFRHALLQEAAYQSMLRGVRREYHLRAARALESDFPDVVALNPEIVAQHYAAAGEARRAAELWLTAGRRALERSAPREASVQLRQGLQMLGKLAVDDERAGVELDLLLCLGAALIAAEGHGAEEVREVYTRADRLAASVGRRDQRFEILTGLATACFVRLEMPGAVHAAEEMLRVAQTAGDPGRTAAARIARGAALLGSGRLIEALAELEAGVGAYDADRDFPLAHLAGQDFGVLGLGYAAYAHGALARPARALERVSDAVRLARSLDHHHSLAIALAFAASVAYFRRDAQRAEPHLEEIASLARRDGFDRWTLGVTPLRAWVRAAQGDADGAMEALRAGRLLESPGPRRDAQTLFWRVVAADVLLSVGRGQDAARLLTEVIDTVEAAGARLWWLPEAYRLRAVSAVALSREEDARGDLRAAVAEASGAGATLFHLRALLDSLRLADSDASAAPGALAAVLAAVSDEETMPEVSAARATLQALRSGAGPERVSG